MAMDRVPRYPPSHGRLVHFEQGPPCYRYLGYADKSNRMCDLRDPCNNPEHVSPFVDGPFSIEKLHFQQQMHFGPGRFGLPTHPFPFNTTFWNTRRTPCCRSSMKLQSELPVERPEAVMLPERMVPGSGTNSRFTNSGFVKSGYGNLQYF